MAERKSISLHVRITEKPKDKTGRRTSGANAQRERHSEPERKDFLRSKEKANEGRAPRLAQNVAHSAGRADMERGDPVGHWEEGQNTFVSMRITDLTIRHLGPKGDGIHHGSQGRVFVERAIPGDRIKARVFSDGEGIPRAEILKILEPSPYRQKLPVFITSAVGVALCNI